MQSRDYTRCTQVKRWLLIWSQYCHELPIPPPIPPNLRIRQNIKKCSECTQSHRRCVFEPPSNFQWTWCNKMHLLCFFQYSGESYYAWSHIFLNSTHPMILLFNFFPEQGRCNDLLTRCDCPVPQDPDDRILLNSTKMRSLVSTPGSTNIISDGVHCNPLSLVASGSRCHTADYLKETKDA